MVKTVVEKVVRIRGDGRGTVGYGLRFCHSKTICASLSPKDNLNTKVVR